MPMPLSFTHVLSIMNRYFSLITAAVITLLFIGCAKDNLEPNKATDHALKIAEGYAIGAGVQVQLYAAAPLTTGYNFVSIALTDSVSGQSIEEAPITIMPMMDMGTMKHSAPVENPASKATNKRFNGALVFTMPSGTMGSWTVEVMVTVNGRQGKATLPATITEPRQSKLKSFVSKVDNKKYWVALVQPTAPKVGVNDLELAIYEAKGMMAFPADSSLAVAVTPEMPTMGHGSPNNIDPVHTGKGHYKGKVNFTMTGLWYLNLNFKKGDAVADNATFFDVNF